MKTIYKYVIRPDKLKVQMPKGARLLTAREQADEICVWAEVDTEQPTEQRHFQVFGTGHLMHEDMGTSREYVGTAHLEGGALVFHVYEYTGV
jgi:hypothetical protein